jgi:rubrerythrin
MVSEKAHFVVEELEGAKDYEAAAEKAEAEGQTQAAEVYRRHAEEEEEHARENAELIDGEEIKPFNDLTYTRRELAGELYEIQKHGSNGSALANCKCIQEKHLIGVRTEAPEGATIATDPKEKEFYRWLGPWADRSLDHVLAVIDANDEKAERAMWATLADDAREIRHSITDETFDIPNPASKRKYLPKNLTTEEAVDTELRAKLSRCIRKAEERCCGEETTDYSRCTCNPVAVCRSSVGTGNPKRLTSKEFLDLYEELRGTKHPEVRYTYTGEGAEPTILEYSPTYTRTAKRSKP